MADPRPVPADGITQDEQAQYLRRSDNGPSEADEERRLETRHGPADEHGVYGAPGEEEA